jgi:hypothetical protein
VVFGARDAPRFFTALCSVSLTVCLLVAAPADAQDALNGKRLYLDVSRVRGAGTNCVDCHGGLPGGLFGIGRAANDAAAVERAIGAIPQMTPLRGRLSARDYAASRPISATRPSRAPFCAAGFPDRPRPPGATGSTLVIDRPASSRRRAAGTSSTKVPSPSP